MSNLNKDVLFLLFEELQQDSKSLFSCLLVNKLWCETVIPILWKNPWSYDYINYHNKHYLYHIITLNLSDETKEFLSSQGIKLFSSKSNHLFFDYLSFCKSINVKVINDIIHIGSSSSSYNKFLLQQEIYKLLMKKCKEFKYLNIISIEHQIFYLPQALIRFESLFELICNTSINSTYFFGLARICHYIQNLIIFNNNTRINLGLVKLIENQKNLKFFKWENDFNDYVEEDTFDEIFFTLTKKSKTLLTFIITFKEGSNYTFPSDILPEFYNLINLKLNFHPIFDFYYDEQFLISFYPNLEILQLSDYILINTVSCLIKNSGGNLKKILINSFDIKCTSFYIDSLNLLRVIYKNCPLIEHLSITFPSSNEHFVEFQNLLLFCKELRVLDILDANNNLMIINNNNSSGGGGNGGKNNNNDDNDNNNNDNNNYNCNNNSDNELKLMFGEIFSNILINSKLINLREIKFYDYFKFSLDNLEILLKNLKKYHDDNIININNYNNFFQISLLTSDPIYKSEEYLKIINKYKDYGIIKDFKFDFERNLLF